jgi:hypothetical protein
MDKGEPAPSAARRRRAEAFGPGTGAVTAAPPPSAPGRPHRVPRDLADPLLRELGGWLDGAGAGAVGEEIASGRSADARIGPALRRLISAHGLASFLVRDQAAAAVVASLPVDLRAWLAIEEEHNRRRIERLLEELRAALRAFAQAGLPVMPLKGAVLATRSGADPFRRPMADIDLLVRPGDRDVARLALAALGYRRRPDRTRRPTHDTFELPGNDRVVTTDGEHPDNPRRIELHTEVRRHLWAWVDDDDLTPCLWDGAAEATVLGEAAILPAAEAFLAHLAIHATSDLLMARGRLIQWLDLADVAGGSPDGSAPAPDLGLAGAPHPRLVYPAVLLAVRRLPGRFPPAGPAGLADLEARVPGRLARWVSSVPLDTHAGLQAGRHAPGDVATLGARWSRWAPDPWRLAVAYGDMPLAVAALRHAGRVVSMARRRPA